MLSPQTQSLDGSEYDFKKDAPVPVVGTIPDYLTHNTIVADWYPRIQTVQSRGIGQATQKDKVMLHESHLALLDYDALFFELERFERERAWHNINVTRTESVPCWKTLTGIHYLPKTSLNERISTA